MQYNIALVPGDGVGSEITTEAVKVLDSAASKYGFGVKTRSLNGVAITICDTGR